MNFTGNTLRIVAADDSAVIRHMLSMLFESVAEHAGADGPRMMLAATVADGVSCVETVRSLRPDLLAAGPGDAPLERHAGPRYSAC